MIKIFKTFGGYIEIPQVQPGCWINVIRPTADEISQLSNEFKLPADSINDILDAGDDPLHILRAEAPLQGLGVELLAELLL